MKKSHKVVMLATEDKVGLGVIFKQINASYSDLGHEEAGNLIINVNPTLVESNEFFEAQHLYILSDEDIVEGDWLIHYPTKLIIQDTTGDNNWMGSKKVIATTDTFLTSPATLQFGNMEMVDINEDGSHYHYKGETELSLSRKELIAKSVLLPLVPQSFVEDYAKAGGIDEVELLYTKTEQIHIDTQTVVGHHVELKINKNGTVVIVKPREKRYSKEEVHTLVYNAMKFKGHTPLFEFHEYCKEVNL